MATVNVTPDIVYCKCHNSNEKKEAKVHVCLICGNVFHRSCFSRQEKVSNIDGAL